MELEIDEIVVNNEDSNHNDYAGIGRVAEWTEHVIVTPPIAPPPPFDPISETEKPPAVPIEEPVSAV